MDKEDFFNWFVDSIAYQEWVKNRNYSDTYAEKKLKRELRTIEKRKVQSSWNGFEFFPLLKS